MITSQKYSNKVLSKRKRNRKFLLIAIAFSVLIFVIGGLYFFINDDKRENTSVGVKTKQTSVKKEVRPKNPRSIKKRQPVEPKKEVEKKAKTPKEVKPQRVGEIRDGYRLLCDGTLHRVLGVVTNKSGKFSLADKTFKHSADVELGNILMVEPGDDLLGDTAGMYRGFNKEFDEALAEPIEYSDKDTPLQRELKQAVNELRKELKDRRANGEDIEKIMEDTRNQLKELSLYRQELEDEVRKLSTEDLTQKDYEDLVKAANQMLKERGIKPLEMPSTIRHAIRLRKIQEKAATKAKKGNSNEH